MSEGGIDPGFLYLVLIITNLRIIIIIIIYVLLFTYYVLRIISYLWGVSVRYELTNSWASQVS